MKKFFHGAWWLLKSGFVYRVLVTLIGFLCIVQYFFGEAMDTTSLVLAMTCFIAADVNCIEKRLKDIEEAEECDCAENEESE